ncbi:MAG: sensor histidine kinase [Oscillospiraceae bacterium]|nr:sensor histidine kinase [Oscillospiraceae bacterium]
MRFFAEYLRKRIKPILVFIVFAAIFCGSFVLYRLPVEAALYPTFICALIGFAVLLLDARKAYHKHNRLRELLALPSELLSDFPEPSTMEDEDYQAIIGMLRDERIRSENRSDERFSEMIEYYTLWAHQIKTPIASMRLQLQNDDSDSARRLLEDLFRIEQYVGMVLCYLRLDSNSTDYVFREVPLDDVIRAAVKKYAAMFIRRKITLQYEPVGVNVTTDEKWLLFVIEQVLSNALKYTPEGGSITIGTEEATTEARSVTTLFFRDTGIGIAPEDLPRVFEKGYTGRVGRIDMKASGIGLYLCRRITKNLGHGIRAESTPGRGTVIRIDFDRKKNEFE